MNEESDGYEHSRFENTGPHVFSGTSKMSTNQNKHRDFENRARVSPKSHQIFLQTRIKTRDLRIQAQFSLRTNRRSQEI